MLHRLPATLVLCSLFVASQVQARTFVWEMSADESQVANSGVGDGSTDSAATGGATITYDTKTRRLTYDIDWNGLEGDLTKIHIHGPADPGQSNRAHLFNVFTEEVDVLTSGVDRTTDSVQAEQKLRSLVLDTRSPFGPGQALRFMLDGRGYVNIHTNLWPNGEIRADFVLTAGVPRTGTNAQRKCANTVTSAFMTVAKREAKEAAWCIAQAAAGTLVGDLEDCIEGDPRGKVAKAVAKVDPGLDGRCRGFDDKGFNEYPFFGAPDLGAVLEMGAAPDTGSVETLVYELADEASFRLVEDLFGDGAGGVLSDGASADEACQAAGWKRARKCHLRFFEGFDRCKRRGLKGGKGDRLYDGAGNEPFDEDEDLEGCVGFDDTGDIAAACGATALETLLGDACDGADLETAFPEPSPESLADAAAALASASVCRACEALAELNGMSVDCDLVDDEVDNDSCEDD
ncbi:MAG: CHRD domain-containing protein [Myxococcota bacterium]